MVEVRLPITLHVDPLVVARLRGGNGRISGLTLHLACRPRQPLTQTVLVLASSFCREFLLQPITFRLAADAGA